MFASSFAYHKAESVADAVGRLQANPDAKILSGGHSLIPAMKLRLAMPSELVDISALDELKSIALDDEVRIGAAVTYQEIASHQELGMMFPILPEAIHQVGDLQVRARGTLGGSIAHADPAADLTAVFVALNGRVEVTGPSGTREIAADDFFKDLWTTALEPDDVLTTVVLPRPAADARMAYKKHPHPASGYAVAGIAAVLDISEGRVNAARIVVTGATSRPERLIAVEKVLSGATLSPESVEAAVAQAADGLSINGDPYADEEYRAQLVRVLTRRALEQAAG